MKKYLSIVLVCLLVLTGCGKKESSVDVLKSVLENDNKVESITMSAKADISVEEDGINVDLPLSASVKVDIQNETTGNVAISVSDNPFIGAADLYAALADNAMKLYIPSTVIDMMVGIESSDTAWIVQEQDMDEVLETDYNEEAVAEYKKMLDNAYDVITEDDFVFIDKDGDVSHYELRITNDLIKRIAEKLEEEYTEEFEQTINVDVYINTKEDVVTKVEIDMLKLFSDLELEDDSMDLSSFKKFSFALEFSDYNKTTLTIPEDVQNNAITTEEYLEPYIGEE